MFKVVGDGLGTLVGVPIAPKKKNPTEVTTFFDQKQIVVINWYGYQSIRTDLIKLPKRVLSRFDEIF